MPMTANKLANSLLLPLALGLLVAPAYADTPADAPLPTRTDGAATTATTIYVAGGTRSLLKIAVPKPIGDDAGASTVATTAKRDFDLSSLFQVLDDQSFVANREKEGIGIDPASWKSVGAEGVVKGDVSVRGSQTHVELRLYVVARGSTEVLKREYDVPASGVRTATHQFANDVVKYFTGASGSFGTRLVYSATTAKGQKGVFSVESDGQGISKLPSATSVAVAPAVGPGGSVYYAGGLPDGSWSLFRAGTPQPVVAGKGLVFGVAFGKGKMAVVLSGNAQSDIWVGAPDGTGLTKSTSGGLNTHPALSSSGQLAYVSNQGGNPQIYVDGKRVSFKGSYNMAPVWCNDPEGTKILFMGRDGSTWDIFSIRPDGSDMKRLTQGQGSNTYPACSPDGRTVAFFSTREGGGLFTANTRGENQKKIAAVTGESLRWDGN